MDLPLPRKASRLRLPVLALVPSVLFLVLVFLAMTFHSPISRSHLGGGAADIIAPPVLAAGEVAQAPKPGGILKVSAYYGEGSWLPSGGSADVKKARYRKSLAQHKRHAQINGHEQYISQHQYFDKEVNNAYSKIANLLQRNLVEMDKGDKGAKWLFWHDADAVVVNSRVSLDIFLPSPDIDGINFLYTRDNNGFNAGQLYLRVGEWTSLFLAAILTVPHAKDTPLLPFWEQSAMATVVEGNNSYYTERCVEVPRHWINVYVFETKELYPSYDPKKWVHPGSFLIHLVGNTKHEHGWFDHLLTIGDGADPVYHSEAAAASLADEATEFWKKWKSEHGKSWW